MSDSLRNAVRGVNIQRESTTEQVTAALRTSILCGQIKPGTPLREVALAEELQVSRNTIRESARILGAEGLVHYVMNHGIVVADVSVEDLDEIYAARYVVEQAGVDALIESRDSATLRKLSQIVRDLEVATTKKQTFKILESDRDFHLTLVSSTANSRLRRFYEQMQQEQRLALSLAENSSHRLGRTEDDHRLLLEAIESGNRSRARAELQRHLKRGAGELHRLRKMLRDGGEDGEAGQ